MHFQASTRTALHTYIHRERERERCAHFSCANETYHREGHNNASVVKHLERMNRPREPIDNSIGFITTRFSSDYPVRLFMLHSSRPDIIGNSLRDRIDRETPKDVVGGTIFTYVFTRPLDIWASYISFADSIGFPVPIECLEVQPPPRYVGYCPLMTENRYSPSFP